MPRKTLKHLVVIGSLVPVVLSVLTLFLYINFHLFKNIEASHKQAFIHQSLQISKLLSSSADKGNTTNIITALLENPDINGIRVERNGHSESFGVDFQTADKKEKNAQGLATLETDDAFIVTVPIKTGNESNIDHVLSVNFSLLPVTMLQYKTAFTTLLITMAILSIGVIYLVTLYKRATSPINEITHKLNAFESNGILAETSDLQEEYKQLYLSIKDVIDNIQQSKTEMQESINQSNQDLRETLETIEIQNIELDLARKEAIKASKTKSEFLANTSHEIRTPLNGILGFTRLLSRTELNRQQQDYVNTIYHSSENLLSIINDILDLSKIEAGKLVLEQAPFNLEDTAEETLSILSSSAHEKKLELLFSVDPALPKTLIGDALRIKQILTNLLGNAIKFCDEGVVELEILVARNDERFAHIKLAVSDTGPGFDQNRESEIFNSFTQLDGGNSRQFSGTGLGLSITRKLVQEMGGEISAKSTPGHGSTFTCSIPLKKDTRKENVEETSHHFDNPVILFDGNERSRISTLKTLENNGVKTTLASKFSDIIPLIESGKKTGKPQLIVNIQAGEQDPMFKNLLLDTLKNCGETTTLLLHPTSFKPDKALPSHVTLLTKPLTRKKLHKWQQDSLSDLGQTKANETLYRGTALVVDDNRANLLLLSSILKELGCKVFEASSGHDAYEQASNNLFDIIFMDIQMPGMDGLETTRRIRKELPAYKDTPVIAVTAHAYDEQKRKVLTAGMNDCLGKPVNEKQLGQSLTRWLSEKQSAQAHETEAVNIALSIERCNHKTDIASAMLSSLVEELPETMSRSQQLIDENQLETAVDVIHRLHGTACYTGTPALQNSCKELEKNLKERSHQNYQSAYLKFKHEAERVLSWARKNNMHELFSTHIIESDQDSKN